MYRGELRSERVCPLLDEYQIRRCQQSCEIMSKHAL